MISSETKDLHIHLSVYEFLMKDRMDPEIISLKYPKAYFLVKDFF